MYTAYSASHVYKYPVKWCVYTIDPIYVYVRTYVYTT
jgi:hypothetical protein